MRSLVILLVAVLLCASGSLARKGFGPGEQEWDHVQVRPKAYMFWWLYFTTANVSSYYERPLVIWLQGGPGGSSTSYGNFEELGPLDADLKPRNHSWVNDYNVLFIDNPVGTGFSYVTSDSAYATNNAQIAADLVECMRGFYKKLPQFKDVPVYITTESYGGKMGAEFALLWNKEEKAGRIQSNLRGVYLGDAWVSPIDSVMTWAPFLLATGMVDTVGYNKVDTYAKMTKKLVDEERWASATNYWGITEGIILQVTNNIDFYNILSKMNPRYFLAATPTSSSELSESGNELKQTVYQNARALENLMNGPVRKELGIQVEHCVQCNSVFLKLRGDFMKPVINEVELLLNQTDIKVAVVTGQLDLIVDTPGTLVWVEKLKWYGAENWQNARRVPIVANNIIEGYAKKYDNLAFYWINRAGHMVPKDNPAGTAKLMEEFTSTKN